MEQPFASMYPPPSPADLVDQAFRRARKKGVEAYMKAPRGLKAKAREEAKVTCAGGMIISALGRILESTPRLTSVHPFYRELVDALVGVDGLRKALAHVRWGKEMVARLMSMHVKEVRRAKSFKEAAMARRAFYGRLNSILMDMEDSLKLLKEAALKLRGLPAVDVEGVVIVVAGAPNVGKSSFVRCVSTAKPAVASYPFTTRNVLLGHVDLGHIKVQVMDTPGLLDRPIHERNPAERQAIAALRHVAKAVIFIVDPSETSGYSLDEQIDVYREVVNELSSAPCTPALNKVDLASEEQVKRAEGLLGGRVLRMVASRCEGVKEVLQEALRLCGVVV